MARKRTPLPSASRTERGTSSPQIAAGERTPESTGTGGDLGGEGKGVEGAEREVKITLYTVTTWSGLPHYHCALCDFDTMRLDAMEIHLQKHMPEVALEEEPASAPELGAIYEIDLDEVLKGGTDAENNLK